MRWKCNLLPKDIKAQRSLGFLYYVIVAFIAMVLILVIISNIESGIKTEVNESACRLSVEKNSALKIGGMDFSKSINCPTKRIIIKEDLRTLHGQENTKRIIAENMAECWALFKKGKANLFSGDGIFCHSCAIIEFENPKSSFLDGFTKFYTTEKIKKGPGTGKTYSEFISQYREGDTFENSEIQYYKNKDKLNTSQKYVIMFYYLKGENQFKTFYNKLATGSTGYIVSGGLMAGGAVLMFAGGALCATVIGCVLGAPIVAVGSSLVGAGGAGAISTVIGSKYATPPSLDSAAFIYLKQYNKQEAFDVCTYLPVNQGEWWTET